MKQRVVRLIFTLVFLLAGSSAIQAQTEPLKSEMTAYLVKHDGDGQEVLVPTDNASPGELIEYVLVYQNTGRGPLSGLALNGPVPANTKYVAGTAKTGVKHDFLVSIDNGKTWESEPVKRQRQKPDGTMQKIVVGAEEYTGLKWMSQEDLQPGAIQEYRYRVRIQ